MLNRLGFIIALVCVCHLSKAQYKFSSDPAVFVTEINTMMAKYKKTMLPFRRLLVLALHSVPIRPISKRRSSRPHRKWENQKKAKAHPNFTDFFIAHDRCKNQKQISNANLDTLLIITNKIPTITIQKPCKPSDYDSGFF